MNNEIKLTLCIVIKGRKRKESKEKYVIKTPRGLSRRHYFNEEPAKLHINIIKEAYDKMISAFECPSFMKKATWSRLNSKERLEINLQNLCENFQGTSYSYEILED